MVGPAVTPPQFFRIQSLLSVISSYCQYSVWRIEWKVAGEVRGARFNEIWAIKVDGKGKCMRFKNKCIQI